jgi:hypothetical protein
MTKHQAPQRITDAWPHHGLRLAVRAVQGCARWRVRVTEGPRDRGDVPGWVLVTIMTAGLVVALWAIAGPKLGQLFGDAVDSVHGP